MQKRKDLIQTRIVLYSTKEGPQLKVKLEKETLWLTQKQIAQLYSTDRSVITRHINNIFKTDELEEKRNMQKMHIPFSDKPVKFFNITNLLRG